MGTLLSIKNNINKINSFVYELFQKIKFRESLLIIVILFIAIVYFTTNTISVEYGKAVQEIMDARVEEAVEEALK